MPTYYFDIETYGRGGFPNPDTDKIVTIQFQRIDLRTGKPRGGLTILKEWESSEEGIVKAFYNMFFADENVWDFIPVGFNLKYEWEFLIAKFSKYTGRKFSSREFHFSTPNVDLQPLLVLLNKGNFKGASLHNFTKKPHGGSHIKLWYENEEFDRIENYVKVEAEAFLEFLQQINRNIPKLLD